MSLLTSFESFVAPRLLHLLPHTQIDCLSALMLGCKLPSSFSLRGVLFACFIARLSENSKDLPRSTPNLPTMPGSPTPVVPRYSPQFELSWFCLLSVLKHRPPQKTPFRGSITSAHGFRPSSYRCLRFTHVVTFMRTRLASQWSEDLLCLNFHQQFDATSWRTGGREGGHPPFPPVPTRRPLLTHRADD